MDSARVHVVVGTEGLLVERAVSAIVESARTAAGDGGMGLPGGAGDAVPVTRIRAGDVDQSELVELLSPSLFAEDRVVVVEFAHRGDDGGDLGDLHTLVGQGPCNLPHPDARRGPGQQGQHQRNVEQAGEQRGAQDQQVNRHRSPGPRPACAAARRRR